MCNLKSGIEWYGLLYIDYFICLLVLNPPATSYLSGHLILVITANIIDRSMITRASREIEQIK